MNAPPRVAGFDRLRTIAEAIEGHARERGNDIAFRFRSRHATQAREITWGELDDRARRIAAGLDQRQVAGQPVAVICPAPLDFVVALCGCLYAAAVVVPVPAVATRRAAERIRSTIETARPRAILAPAAVLQQPWIAELLISGERDGIDLDDVSEGEPIVRRRETSSPEALMQFTSGSTGTPRGVILSHQNLAANCTAIVDAYGLSAATRGFSWLPLHHDMGLVGHVLTPLWIGCRSTLMDPLLFLQSPLRWLRFASEEAATITSAPNFAFELCVKAAEKDDLDGIDLSSLTAAVCGGEPVWPETMERFCAVFGEVGFNTSAFAPSYGLAEATLLVSSGRRVTGPGVFSGSVRDSAAGDGEATVAVRTVDLGRPVAGVTVHVVDDQGSACLEKVIGEIELSGPCVGLLVDGDEKVAGPVRTGDLGFIADGAVHISGRRKELIILRGQNVYPTDIENAAVRGDPAVQPGAVAALAITSGGTEAMVLVFEGERGLATEARFKDICRNLNQAVTRATGHAPSAIATVRRGALPRTTSGKIKRTLAARLLTQGDLMPLAIMGDLPVEAEKP